MEEKLLERKTANFFTELQDKTLAVATREMFLAQIQESRENALPELRKLLSARLKKTLFSSEEKVMINELVQGSCIVYLSLDREHNSSEEVKKSVSEFRMYLRAAKLAIRKGETAQGLRILVELLRQYITLCPDIIPVEEVQEMTELAKKVARVSLLHEINFYKDQEGVQGSSHRGASYVLGSVGELCDIPLLRSYAGKGRGMYEKMRVVRAENTIRIRACLEPVIEAFSDEQLKYWELPENKNSRQLTQIVMNLLDAIGIGPFLAEYTFLGVLGRGSYSPIIQLDDGLKLKGLVEQRLEAPFLFGESDWPYCEGECHSERFFEEHEFLERKRENNFQCTLTARGQEFVLFLMVEIGKVLDKMAGRAVAFKNRQLEDTDTKQITE